MDLIPTIDVEAGGIERLGSLWPPLTLLRPGSLNYPPFRSPRICVAGSYQTPLPRDLADCATLLGRVLAAAGFHLVTGGSPGVEAIVGDAFSQRESLWPEPPSPRRTRVFLDKEAPERLDLSPTRITEVGAPSMEEVIELSLDRCDVLILVAGSGGTARVGRRAARRGIPVLPLGGTGGDAAKFLDELPSTSPAALSREAMSILAGDPIAAIVQLPQIIRALASETRKPVGESGSSSATSAPTADPFKSTFQIRFGPNAPSQTAFALGEPPVLVTDSRLWHSSGRIKAAIVTGWRTVESIVDVSMNSDEVNWAEFDVVRCAYPQSGVESALPIRTTFQIGAPDGRPNFRGIESVRILVAAGSPSGMVRATVINPEAQPVPNSTARLPRPVIRIRASLQPGALGAPVLDDDGAVCGMVVGTASNGGEAYVLPSFLWATPLQTKHARKAETPRSTPATKSPASKKPAQKSAAPKKRSKQRGPTKKK